MMIMAQGKALVAARLRAGFGQRAFSRLLDLSSGFLSQVENGKRGVSAETAKKICDTLGADFDDLFALVFSDQAAAHDSA